MSKLLVFYFLFLIITVSGSKHESLSDLDTQEVNKSDSLIHPCSTQNSQSVLTNKILLNERNKTLSNENISSSLDAVPEDIKEYLTIEDSLNLLNDGAFFLSSTNYNPEPRCQQPNEVKKKEKVPIVLDCIVKINEKTVTETVKGANVNSRRSPDIQYLMETKGNFRDFTTKSNRTKINEEPTIVIDISEKRSNVEPKLNYLDSGRRFNIPYNNNIHETNHSSEYDSLANTHRDNQFKTSKERDQDLSVKKVLSNSTSNFHEASLKDNRNNSSERDGILNSNKEFTDIPSAKNPDLPALSKSKIYKESDETIHSKELSNKPSAKKYDSISTLSPDMYKDSLMYLDFRNKKVGNKPSVIKYDLITKLKNKTSDYKEVSNKPNTKKYENTATPNVDIYKDLFLHHDLGNKVAASYMTDKYSADKYDQTVIQNNINQKHRQDLYHKEHGNYLSTKKYEQMSTPNDNIYKDLFLYHDISNTKENDKSALGTHPLDQSYKENSDKFPTKKYKQISTPNDGIFKEYNDSRYKKETDKSSAKKYDLKPVIKNSDEVLYHRYKEVSNKPITEQYEPVPTLFHHINKEVTDKPPEKYEPTSTLLPPSSDKPSNDMYEPISTRFYPSLKEVGDKSSSEVYDQISTLVHPSYKEVNYKPSSVSDKSSTEIYDPILPLLRQVSGKPYFKKFGPVSTTYDDISNELMYQDLSNKEASDKSSVKKYDLKSVLKNIKIFMEHNGDPNYKEAGDKSYIKKYNASSLLNSKIYKDLFLHRNLGDKEDTGKDSAERYDLKSIVKNITIFNEDNRGVGYKEDTDKPFNKKYDLSSAIRDDLYEDLYNNKEANENLSNKKNDLKFKLNNNKAKEQDQGLNQRGINDLYLIKQSQDELRTTVDVTEPHLVEPTTGYSIKDLFKARVMLLESTRVCYACSSISDHSCWQPGRSTTVKYCRKGHNACLTKTFKTEESEFIVIRDCGTTCDGSWPVLDPRYKSCSICNKDMCNDHLIDINSGHINSFNFLYFVTITVIIKIIV